MMRERHLATPMLIETHALTLRRGDRELLRELSLSVRAGERWGLIGPNGAGKTTLLEALAQGGGPAVASGRVRRAPGVWLATVGQGEGVAEGEGPDATLRDLAHAVCAPLVELGAELERRAAALGDAPDAAALEAYGVWQALFEQRGGYDLDVRLDEALGRIGLPYAPERLAAAASGGERRRAHLAGALVAGSDVLLLDEPTNHLDLATRGWLAEALQRVPGAVVFASHDRAWIDAVATHVLVLGEGPPRSVRGGWTAARRSGDLARRVDEKADRLRRKRQAELEAMAAELRAQGHRRADVRRRRAERELGALRERPKPAPAIQAPVVELAGGGGGGELARFAHLSAGSVLRDVGLTLRGGDRWALIGPSGSGKSTLLRLLAGEVDSDDARARRWWRPGTSVWHLDQHRRGLDDDAAPLDELGAWVGATRAAGLLASVRLPRAAWTRPAATLSGGERARAGVALLMAREPDVLLLDEPTNDLDLPAIEALEAALVATSAIVVVATHDARLVEALGAEVVTIEAGALVRWRGGLVGWRRGVRRVTPGAGADAPGGATAADGGAVPAPLDGADAGAVPAPLDGADSAAVSAPLDGADAGAVPAPLIGADGAAVPAPIIGADAAAWDRERAVAEAALSDPLRWGERETERWRERRRVAEEALLAAWERTATPAQPPYRTREGGWRVWAEPVDEGLHVWLDGDEPLAHAAVGGPRDGAGAAGRVAHVVLAVADDRCLTAWAFRALLRGAARLAIYTQAVDAVQVAASRDPGGFEPLAPGWWVQRREALEAEERWAGAGFAARVPATPRRRRRRRRRRAATGPASGER